MPSRITVEPVEMFGLTMYAVCIYGCPHHHFEEQGLAEAAAAKLRCKLKEKV